MKKIDLGQTLQLVGNVGVIVGILLLVYELNQNRDMMRAQTRNEIANGIIAVMSLSSGNTELADARVLANQGGELSPAQRILLSERNEALFRYWENSHYQFRQGMYDEGEFSRHLTTMRDVMVTLDPQLIEHWCGFGRGHYSAPFTEEIDRLIGEDRCN